MISGVMVFSYSSIPIHTKPSRANGGLRTVKSPRDYLQFGILCQASVVQFFASLAGASETPTNGQDDGRPVRSRWGPSGCAVGMGVRGSLRRRRPPAPHGRTGAQPRLAVSSRAVAPSLRFG